MIPADLEQGRIRLELDTPDEATHFDPLTSFDIISWDYTFTSHSPRGHPLEPLRHELAGQRIPDAATVRRLKDGRRIRYAGLVISRQRPGTAKGVVFMTLEDETGFVNVVLWDRVFSEHAALAKTASFLGVTGKLQVQSGVVHLVAEKLWAPEVAIQPQETKSRDFH